MKQKLKIQANQVEGKAKLPAFVIMYVLFLAIVIAVYSYCERSPKSLNPYKFNSSPTKITG